MDSFDNLSPSSYALSSYISSATQLVLPDGSLNNQKNFKLLENLPIDGCLVNPDMKITNIQVIEEVLLASGILEEQDLIIRMRKAIREAGG